MSSPAAPAATPSTAPAMTDTPAPAPQSQQPPAPPAAAGDATTDGTGPLETPLPAGQLADAIDQLARRGKIPGYAKRPGGFTATAYGEPFDALIVGTVGPGSVGSRVSFALQPRWKLPIIFGVVIILTIWPGIWLTDSMLRTYFPAYDFPTWVWYLPLTILPLPWILVRMVRRSRAANAQSVRELRETIAAAVPAAAA